MIYAQSLETSIERLRGDNVLVRRMIAETAALPDTVFGGSLNINFESMPSGIILSQPELLITRAEVVMAAPGVSVKEGDTVLLPNAVRLSPRVHWLGEDGREYMVLDEGQLLNSWEIVDAPEEVILKA